MCDSGQNPRTDPERRRLFGMAGDVLTLLRYRYPGRSEDDRADAVGDAVLKWLSLEVPIALAHE